MNRFYVLIGLIAIAIIACVGDTVTSTQCAPGQEFSCTCPNGQASSQACNKTGNGFDPCQCSTTTDGGNTTTDGSTISNDADSTTTDSMADVCTPLTKVQACTNPSDAGLPFCGNHSDNCGGNINCGSPGQCGTTCTNGDTCLTTQVCGHDGSCNWQGFELCNSQSDLCGGSINCGSCNYGTCLYGQLCACGRSSSYDSDCSGGSPHAYRCQFGGGLSSPCTLVDNANHIYCCP